MYFSTIGRSIALFNRLLKKSKNDKYSYEAALSRKNCIITNLISAFQKAIELLDVVCRKALKTVIDFDKESLTRQFTFEQACAVNDFFIQTPTDNMLPIHCLYCPIPSSRKTTIPKGDWRCRTWSTTFQNTKRLRKKRWDIRPSRGLKI